MTYTFYIKNIFSKSDKKKVLTILSDLRIKIIELKVGSEIVIESKPSDRILRKLADTLRAGGYDIIDDKRASITSKIKAIFEDLVERKAFDSRTLQSEFLSQIIHYEYHYMSTLFSQLEGLTIKSFVIRLRIEQIKEMIESNEMNFTEMAHLLGYSSPGHFSNQFKKVLGVTPSQYRATLKI